MLSPNRTMRERILKPACILLGMLSLCAFPAHSQIVSYANAQGKRIFINADPPASARSAATRKTPPAAGVLSRTTQTRSGASAKEEAASSANLQRIETMIHEVSERYHVDPALVRAVVQTESNGDPQAVSRKGALGLMQLVPGTAQQMGVGDAFDPKQNLDGGVRYLRILLERYNGDLDKALAAYNAGPGAVDRAGGVPRYPETRAYVQKVTDSYFRPGSGRLTSAMEQKHPIYRIVTADGRVVFMNE